MPEKCDKTFSTKEFSDLKAAISPFVKTRYTRVKNDIGPGTHDGAVDAILPCGIAQQETTIEPRLRKNHSHARAHPAHAQREFREPWSLEHSGPRKMMKPPAPGEIFLAITSNF